MDVSSNAVSWMVTSVLGFPSFSASDLMALGVDFARVFQLTTTLCEHGGVIATNVEVCEGVDVRQPMVEDVVVEQPLISNVDNP
jgi:hypothetical protein